MQARTFMFSVMFLFSKLLCTTLVTFSCTDAGHLCISSWILKYIYIVPSYHATVRAIDHELWSAILAFQNGLDLQGCHIPFLDRVRGPYKLGKLLTFWGNWEIFHIFKMKNKTDIFFWYTVIFKIQCSLPRWEVLIFLIALENCSSNSLLKSNCKHNWEFFNIKFRKYVSICHWESWFQPQFVGSDGPDLHRVTRFDLILHNLIFGTTISSQFFYRNQLTLRRTLSYLNHQLFLQKPRLIL